MTTEHEEWITTVTITPNGATIYDERATRASITDDAAAIGQKMMEAQP